MLDQTFISKLGFLVMAAGACLLVPAPGVLAAGGSTSSPSMSSPRRPPVDVFAEYRKGLKALEVNDYNAARKAFKKVIRAEKKNGNAYAYLGIAEYGRGKYKNSRKALEKALKYDTIVPGAWETLGLAQLKLGAPEKAQEQLAALHNMMASCPAPCSNSASIQQAIDSLSQALAAQGTPEAQLFRPDEGSKAYVQAVRLINQEHYAQAITRLTALHQSQPQNADVLTYLGYSHRKLHEYDVAIDYYRQALAINPAHVGATEYLGELYVELGQLDKAQSQLARLDDLCTYGCFEYQELESWIASAARGSEG